MGGPPPPYTPPQPLHKAGPRGSLGVRPGVRGYGRGRGQGQVPGWRGRPQRRSARARPGAPGLPLLPLLPAAATESRIDAAKISGWCWGGAAKRGTELGRQSTLPPPGPPTSRAPSPSTHTWANNGGKAAQGQGGPYNLGGGTWGRHMRGPLLSSWGDPGSNHDPLDSSQRQAGGFPQSPCWRGTSPHPDLSECQGEYVGVGGSANLQTKPPHPGEVPRVEGGEAGRESRLGGSG